MTLFCSDQLFSSTKTFIRLRSNPTNTFSPIKYLLFWRHHNGTNTIIPHYLAIIRRNSTWDVVSLHFWSKILEITSYRIHFHLRCRSLAEKNKEKQGNNSQLLFKAFDYKCRILNSSLQNIYFSCRILILAVKCCSVM